MLPHCTKCNCIIEMTEILVVIDEVCQFGQYFDTSRNVMLQLPFWHCTPLVQVITGLDYWSQIFHHSLDKSFGLRHFIVSALFCSICIQLSVLKQLLLGFHLQNLSGSLLTIWLSVYLLSSIIALCGSWEVEINRLPSWRMWSVRWFRHCMFTKLKPNLLTRCYAISDSICGFSSSM